MRISDWSSDVCSSDLTAGLTLRDASGRLYYAARHPSAVYPDFNAVPPLVVNALLFIENRELLNPETDRKSVVQGKSVSVRVVIGGRRIIKKKRTINTNRVSR